MRLVLVMDTVGGEGYAGLCDVDAAQMTAVAERTLPARGTQETLLPAVAALLAVAGVALDELAAVAVVGGPGSFTGVRIGLATAKGLCEAQGLRLAVLSRLQVLAYAAAAGWMEVAAEEAVCACLDAGRGEVYAQTFLRGEPADEARLLPLAAVRAEAAGARIAVVEDAVERGLAGCLRVHAEVYARALRGAAVQAVRDGRWADVALSDAAYVRVPDAELALRARTELPQAGSRS